MALDKLWDQYFITYCAPTLAGIKTANLFGMCYGTEYELMREINRLNSICMGKGLCVKVLSKSNNRALVYVYRKKMLAAILSKDSTWNILEKYGYKKLMDEGGHSVDMEAILSVLKHRLATEETFPHEIGIFLGYPIKDVIGFIETSGSNYLCKGHWKVYANAGSARRAFAKFDMCKRSFVNSYNCGVPVANLIVAV